MPEVAVPVAQMHIKLPEKEPIITYLALRCGLSASWSVDVISLRLERLKRLLETVPFRFSSNSQQVFAEDEPLKLLFTGLTKQQYVL